MNGVTHEGKQLIDRWTLATQSLADAKARVNSAECELSNSATALGKWLLPPDAEYDEKFAVWYGDSLISAVKPNAKLPGEGDYKITIRTRGKSLNRV